MNAPSGPLCICGWNVVVVTIGTGLLMLTYGELEGRRRSAADRDARAESWLEEQRVARGSESSHDADTLTLPPVHDDHCG